MVIFTKAKQPGTADENRIVYGLTAVVLSFAWYALVALAVSHEAVRGRFRAVGHWVERTTGAILILLGVRLAFSRTSS